MYIPKILLKIILFRPDDATFILRLPEIFETPRTSISFEEAIFFAGAIALDSLMSVFLVHPYMMGVMHQGMKCRVGACSLIYRKVRKKIKILESLWLFRH